MKKITLLFLIIVVITSVKAQNLIVESGSPASNTATSIGLILSDPTSFNYIPGTSTYDVFIETNAATPTTHYSSYSDFTMTDVGSGVYHLNTTVARVAQAPVGNYNVRVHNNYNGADYSCTNCFSIICINTSGTDTQTACFEYTWIDGITYTESNNTATFILPNAGGCDSVVTLDLTINTVDITVTNSDPTLTANQDGGSYQWVDCNDGYAFIPGETNQSFTATENGDFAVIVTFNNCTDTSVCNNIANVVGVYDISASSDLTLYPNPSDDQVILEFEKQLTNARISVADITGKQIYLMENISGQKVQLSVGHLRSGIYFVQVQNGTYIFNIKLIKK